MRSRLSVKICGPCGRGVLLRPRCAAGPRTGSSACVDAEEPAPGLFVQVAPDLRPSPAPRPGGPFPFVLQARRPQAGDQATDCIDCNGRKWDWRSALQVIHPASTLGPVSPSHKAHPGPFVRTCPRTSTHPPHLDQIISPALPPVSPRCHPGSPTQKGSARLVT